MFSFRGNNDWMNKLESGELEMGVLVAGSGGGGGVAMCEKMERVNVLE